MRKTFLFLSLAALLVSAWLGRPAIAEDKFTLAILPDVQQEVWSDRFQQRLQWLVDNRATLNLKAMLQCGDMMNYNLDAHYAHQSAALTVLDNASFPYATCLGNHDTAAVRSDSGSAAPGNTNTNLRITDKYDTYFPTTRFKMLSGVYEAGRISNAYHIFTAGGLKWLVINLELWPRSAVVAWAKTIVASYPNHNVIFLTHAHLNSNSTIQQDNGGYGNSTPQYVFDQAMKPYANVRLVFSGHVGTWGYRTDTGTNGNTIYQFLQAYHDSTTNPTRLLEIDTKNGAMRTWVYCPSIGQNKNDGSEQTITGIQWVRPAPVPVQTTIGALRMAAKDSYVMVHNAAVTAVFSDSFYAQQADRAAGVRVYGESAFPTAGQTLADLSGRVDNAGINLMLADAQWSVYAGSPIAFTPLGLRMRDVGGAALGLQRGVQNGLGLNNIGLLVTVWGRVAAIDAAGTHFYIDDGSGAADNSDAGVRVVADGRAFHVGQFVRVKGISVCYTDYPGRVARLIRVANPGDVRPL